MKRAVNLTAKNGGDDGKDNRLLSSLKTNLPFQIDELIQIREHVYVVKTNNLKFVLKGFSSLRRLKIQRAFTDSLKKEGFHRTYSFYSFCEEPSLYIQSRYYGCIEYIEQSDEPFFYNTKEHCQEGLEVLHHFHKTSEKLVGSYGTILPSFHLIDKWEERLALFKSNLSLASFFLQKSVCQEMFTWANWSLAGLKQECDILGKLPNVILHGDVAYHNFLRTTKEELFLIDFDLISIGPEAVDYLQYANRILPFLNWSCEQLAQFEQLQPYLKQKFFLYALAFPSDIFREWNRLVRERTYHDRKKVRPVMELTLGQFKQRREFFNELVRLVKG